MGWLDRFRKRGSIVIPVSGQVAGSDAPGNAMPPDFRLPASLGLQDGVEAELRERAWQWVARGDDDAGSFVECMEDDISEWNLDEATVEAAFAAVVAARRAQQSRWPPDAKTALTRAFEALAGRGIVAREHFSCCGTCASGEIFDERDDSRTWRGYVYYHQQDTDRLIEDRSTYIGYGAFLDAWTTEAEWKALPEAERERRHAQIVTSLMRDEVIPVLEAHGATVVWDGDLGTRIHLANVDYLVRLP
ncbi:hypothetical protein J2X02_000757 [Pseudoxanthomonas japonensis]|uniref:DUF6891 domain-containing protein n=1 Tax=Pseudoxanthomonas japonensis TaxID=69284 RepID=UPI002866F837|nr:hypothetical protein [Pseudoxanthomonas japonensis]MDR7067940.1 hypothetical protein [Pseudoxanthomonas japonensis]